MLPVLQLGPMALQLPGLLLLAGVWIANSLAERAARGQGLSPAMVTNLIFYSLVVGVLGARLGYALRFLPVYLSDPLGLVSLNPSTLSLPDGVVAGSLMALAYGQRRGLPFWPTLDALAPGLAAFGVAIGAAHLASGDAFGAASDLPWALQLWGARRHPTQVYEILFALASLGLVLRASSRRFFPGLTFLAWLALAALSRLILEAFRGDSVIIFGGLRQAQLISLALLLVAMVTIHLRAKGGGTGESGTGS